MKVLEKPSVRESWLVGWLVGWFVAVCFTQSGGRERRERERERERERRENKATSQ